MKDFMLLIEGDGRTCTPQDMQVKMAAYGPWMQKYSNEGKYISGSPFLSEGVSIDENGQISSEGSFLNPDTIIGGYVHLKASDISEATKIARECPLINPMRLIIRPFHAEK